MIGKGPGRVRAAWLGALALAIPFAVWALLSEREPSGPGKRCPAPVPLPPASIDEAPIRAEVTEPETPTFSGAREPPSQAIAPPSRELRVEVDRPQANPQRDAASDPEEELISGNVDLAARALELARMRAAGTPDLAERERDYASAKARQAERLEKAGLSPDEPEQAAPSP